MKTLDDPCQLRLECRVLNLVNLTGELSGLLLANVKKFLRLRGRTGPADNRQVLVSILENLANLLVVKLIVSNKVENVQLVAERVDNLLTVNISAKVVVSNHLCFSFYQTLINSFLS